LDEILAEITTKREFDMLDEIDDVSVIKPIAMVLGVLLINTQSVNDWAYDVNE